MQLSFDERVIATPDRMSHHIEHSTERTAHMPTSHAKLETDQAKRYMSLVSKHWGHRFKVDARSALQVTIDFGGSSCGLEARDDSLLIDVVGPDAALSVLEETVVEHLQRFAPKGLVLAVEWRRGT